MLSKLNLFSFCKTYCVLYLVQPTFLMQGLQAAPQNTAAILKHLQVINGLQQQTPALL
jgi:hypothetical protein